MPARAIATGSISFGLVTIPVRLYTATQSTAGVHFNLLHKGCGSRLRQQYICPKDEVIVSRDEMVKGYEFAKDQYVTFTTDELKALEEKSTQTIDITEFVPLDKVDPVYFDKPYYLAPDKGGDKAYQLLGEVMRETRRCALAKYAARGKQYLVLLRPVEKGIVMQQLLYADEVRGIEEVPMPDRATLREAELKLAHQLVDQISTDKFDPSQYHDEVKERIEADIQKKVEGQEIEMSDSNEAPAQIIDLMEALKASLGGGGKGKRAAGAGRKNASSDDASSDDNRRPAQRVDDKPARAEKGTAGRTKRSKRSA
jgi:DNA end-binding protein Ku